MIGRSCSVHRRLPKFLFVCAALLLSMPLAAQNFGGPVDITGEASVVIFDDIENDRSEIRYYLIEARENRETRLHFTGRVPDSFTTGKQLRIRGRGWKDGVEVESVAELDGAAGGDGGVTEAALAPPESRNILTLLVDFNDALVSGGNYGTTVQEVRDRMYNESKSVAGLFFNASLGTLTLNPDGDGDGVQDVFHVSIDDSYIGGDAAQCDPSGWVTKASAAWAEANPGKNIGVYRHRLLITPNYWDNGNRHCGWGGVAQVGCGTWCWAIGADPDSIMHGVIVHELGHNFGLNHARKDENNNGYNSAETSTDSEYGDNSDMMGGSRAWKKFNPPHAEDKGWIDPSDYEIRTVVAGGSPQFYDLLPLDDEAWVWPGLRALKLERSANSDYYVTFRRASGGYNALDSQYRDKLNIYYGQDNSTYSYYVTSLAAGQSFTDTVKDLVVSATSPVTVTTGAQSTVAMGVRVCQQGCSSMPAPSGLTATAQATDAILLQWTYGSGDEDGFDIERSPDRAAWSLLTTEPAGSTNYLDSGLASGTEYFYRVRASSVTGDSGWSNVAGASTLGVPPVAGFGFAATFLQVNFTDQSTDADGSVVSWAWDFGDGSGSTARNPSHAYAAVGSYDIVLTVSDDDGESDSVSKAVTLNQAPAYTDHAASSETTVAGTVSGSYLTTAVDDGAVQSITERESGGRKNDRYSYLEHIWTFSIPAGNEVTLLVNAWRSPVADGDGFVLQWSANGGNWSSPMNISATSDSAPQSYGLPAGTSGTVQIRLSDTDRTPGQLALDSVHVDFLGIRVANGTPEPFDNDPPDGLSALATSSSAIELNWTDNGSNEGGFSIERSTGGGAFAAVATIGSNAGATASWSDAGLSGSTTYTYRVRAFKGAEYSAYSNQASATTGTAPAITLSATGYKVKGVQQVDLSWGGASGASVDLYRNDALLTATANDGAHTDAIGAKGAGSYRYRVCQSGSTAACSSEQTVVF